MHGTKFTRRSFLLASSALGISVLAAPLAALPAAAPVTPQLIEAAKKEGKIVWYTSVDLPLAQKVAQAFEAKYPGVSVRVERTGAERVFQRIGQEYSAKIHAVDAVNSSDAAHLLVWKREGILAPYVTEDMAKNYPPEHVDPDGMFASFRATLSPIAYNTKLVDAGEAPKSFKDLLDPKWSGKLVKSHPGYSGSTLTATFQTARDLGWSYFEALSKQKVMQVQSATEPPKKLSLGERAVAVDGVEYVFLQLIEKGNPIAIVYPSEGTPLVVGPSAIFKNAPNPNAARLFHSFLFSRECQQLIVDAGGLRSFHKEVKDKEGRTPLAKIKLMKEDAEAVEKQVEEIKSKYTRLFKV
ncbi:MAG: extracellular solute-binding protein [Alphaproteobacteria bacterium]|nr:extracellular solute-binding protein [Alphaproteobacteria bacterium]